jgi:hypothetical protein
MKRYFLLWGMLLFGIMLLGCSSSKNNDQNNDQIEESDTNDQVGRVPPELVGKWNLALPDQLVEYEFKKNGSYSMAIRFQYDLTNCIKSNIDPQCKKQYCGYFVVASGIAIADKNTIELVEKKHAEAQTDCYFDGDFKPVPPSAPKKYTWKMKVGQYEGDKIVKQKCLYFDNDEFGYMPGSQLD